MAPFIMKTSSFSPAKLLALKFILADVKIAMTGFLDSYLHAVSFYILLLLPLLCLYACKQHLVKVWL